MFKHKPEERWARPKTKAVAVRQINETYDYTRWDAGERAKHQASLGLDPKPLEQRTNDELKVILADFEKSRMILYRD